MLKNTFVHMDGIGEKTEQVLWSNGILGWNYCQSESLEKVVSTATAQKIDYLANLSMDCLDSKDHEFFSRTVPYEHAWRGLHDFEGRVGYLDIETNGLSPNFSKVTVIGIYDGKHVHSYVSGQNLEDFSKDIKKYSVLVTFNGRAFDIPFLKKYCPNVNFNQLHIDLRPTLKSLGITGGLKKIEKVFGFERPTDLQGLTGYDAVKFWNRYEHAHDMEALDKLVRYNAEDILHLEPLAKWAFDKKSEALREKMRYTE